MEKYFKNFEMPEPIKAERILELNVAHPAVKAMAAAMTSDRDKAALYAKILYEQANLIAGLPLEDPGAYTDMVAQRCSKMNRERARRYSPRSFSRAACPAPILAYRRASA